MDGRKELSFGSAPVLLVEVAVAVAVALLLQCALAKTTHVVGDSLGWTLTPDGPVTYSSWASFQTFTVGDILVFNFTTGEHDVAEVSKASFDACDGTRTIGSVINTGPASVILKSQGEHYFICTFIGHCSFSQKLAIKVTAASAPTNPPASSPSISSMPGPTPSEAPRPKNPLANTASPPFVSLSPTTTPILSKAPRPANPLYRTASPSTSPSPMLASMPSKASGPAKPLVGMASPPSVNLSPTLAPSISIAPGPTNPPTRISFPAPSDSPLSMLAPTLTRVPATYVVGDSLGWTIPLGGPATYAAWAVNKTFMVGDTLLFNFTNGEHDVAEVSNASFHACNGTSTIASVINTSPSRITLSSIGDHYFICTFIEHCFFGQKLAIKVTAALPLVNPPIDSPTFISPMIAVTPKASIVPTPANPSTTFTPYISPMPALGPTNPLARIVSPPFISSSPMLAPSKAARPVKPPVVVASPPSINLSPTLAPSISIEPGPANPPTRIASPAPSDNPSSMLAPALTRVPATYVVGDSLGWTIPLGGPATYAAWATGKTFMVGDTLLFNFTNGEHDVAEVSNAYYHACDGISTIASVVNTSPARITLSSMGDHYFICTFIEHCSFGQKLAINVTAASPLANPPTDSPTFISPMIAMTPKASMAPSHANPSTTFPTYISPMPVPGPTNPLARIASPPSISSSPMLAPSKAIGPTKPLVGMAASPSIAHFAASPPSTTPPALAPTYSEAPEIHIVGDSSGWAIPPGGPSVYATWASSKTFAVGDTLLFNFVSGQHDVAEVSKSSFDSCNQSGIINSPIETSPARITLKSPGEHYLICTYAGHCQVGQKLAVNVTATRATDNPSSIAISPSLLATALSPHTPSSASSLTIVGFSIASLTIFAYFFI